MLQSVYSVYDRVRRPLRNHHFLVLPGARLAYARVAGLPQHLARTVLAALGGGSEDSGWFDDVELLTGRELHRRYPQIVVFAFVQPPAERIAAAYDMLITSQKPLPTFYIRHGFAPGMSLPQFVHRICRIGDLRADNLFRSQSDILAQSKGGAALVLRTDQLAKDWSRLQDLVASNTRPAAALPPVPDLPAASPLVALLSQGGLADRLARRYAQDLRLYFGSGEVPGPK